MDYIKHFLSMFASADVKQSDNKPDIGIDPFKNNKLLDGLIREESLRIAKTYQNIVDTELLTKTIYDAFVGGERAESVAKHLYQTFGIPKKDVESILLRCSKKLNAQYRKYHAKDAGLNYYKWQTVPDKKVCPICKGRDGKIFSWDEPPEGGHAGECSLCPTYCRCIARTIVEKVHKINGEYVIKE